MLFVYRYTVDITVAELYDCCHNKTIYGMGQAQASIELLLSYFFPRYRLHLHVNTIANVSYMYECITPLSLRCHRFQNIFGKQFYFAYSTLVQSQNCYWDSGARNISHYFKLYFCFIRPLPQFHHDGMGWQSFTKKMWKSAYDINTKQLDRSYCEGV